MGEIFRGGHHQDETKSRADDCLTQQKAVVDLAKSFHDKVVKSNITDYQLYTRKAIEASSWLKRYTQALLKKEGEAS